MAAIEGGTPPELAMAAAELGLDVLVEVHDRAELDRALRLDARLIGTNGANLTTLHADLHNTEKLSPLLPPGRIIATESGLSYPADLCPHGACVGGRSVVHD